MAISVQFMFSLCQNKLIYDCLCYISRHTNYYTISKSRCDSHCKFICIRLSTVEEFFLPEISIYIKKKTDLILHYYIRCKKNINLAMQNLFQYSVFGNKNFHSFQIFINFATRTGIALANIRMPVCRYWGFSTKMKNKIFFFLNSLSRIILLHQV